MNCIDPPLTTVRQPIEAMGRAAVDLLAREIGGSRVPHDELLFEPELVVRGSTGPAPAFVIRVVSLRNSRDILRPTIRFCTLSPPNGGAQPAPCDRAGAPGAAHRRAGSGEGLTNEQNPLPGAAGHRSGRRPRPHRRRLRVQQQQERRRRQLEERLRAARPRRQGDDHHRLHAADHQEAGAARSGTDDVAAFDKTYPNVTIKSKSTTVPVRGPGHVHRPAHRRQ